MAVVGLDVVHDGALNKDTAASLNNLGHLHYLGRDQGWGDLSKAEPLFARALAIREKVLGPEHEDTATSLNYCGDWLIRCRKWLPEACYYGGMKKGRPVAKITLTDEERSKLEELARRRKTSQAMALRCRIVNELTNHHTT